MRRHTTQGAHNVTKHNRDAIVDTDLSNEDSHDGGDTPKQRPSKNKYMQSVAATTSVERVLCDKCGSPTNMTNMSMNYLKAPSERLQSAPAHRGKEGPGGIERVDSHQTPI